MNAIFAMLFVTFHRHGHHYLIDISFAPSEYVVIRATSSYSYYILTVCLLI